MNGSMGGTLNSGHVVLDVNIKSMYQKGKGSMIKLEDIIPKREDILRARFGRSVSFCRAALWMIIQFENKEQCIYTTDLKKFLGVTTQRAYMLLRDFCDFGLLYQKKISDNFSEFWPVKNDGRIKLKGYEDLAKRGMRL